MLAKTVHTTTDFSIIKNIDSIQQDVSRFIDSHAGNLEYIADNTTGRVAEKAEALFLKAEQVQLRAANAAYDTYDTRNYVRRSMLETRSILQAFADAKK